MFLAFTQHDGLSLSLVDLLPFPDYSDFSLKVRGGVKPEWKVRRVPLGKYSHVQFFPNGDPSKFASLVFRVFDMNNVSHLLFDLLTLICAQTRVQFDGLAGGSGLAWLVRVGWCQGGQQ